ncbi:hypothetical protein BCR42DRAFT_409055 [Absidia repens]|uniref:Uncharacterized protein n=1 Tax=Absidia repens TaxID=90262 RepID=A0A1X2IQL0_9FUNG|nr:hypothetical protein BCR42DRAFT_409055 [Absidia repens]
MILYFSKEDIKIIICCKNMNKDITGEAIRLFQLLLRSELIGTAARTLTAIDGTRG